MRQQTSLETRHECLRDGKAASLRVCLSSNSQRPLACPPAIATAIRYPPAELYRIHRLPLLAPSCPPSHLGTASRSSHSGRFRHFATVPCYEYAWRSPHLTWGMGHTSRGAWCGVATVCVCLRVSARVRRLRGRCLRAARRVLRTVLPGTCPRCGCAVSGERADAHSP